MSILRYEENGVEFFTVQATGESGMSQSGLARLCGVRSHGVSQLLKTVITSSCPDFLKPLQGKDLTLITSVHEFNNVTILRDAVCARILEWYAFESQRPNETAQQAFRKFAAMGIRAWIQGITGWESQSELSRSPVEAPIEASADSEVPAVLAQLEHDLKTALKHRQAIHSLVERPTVVDLSLQQIVHTAVHVQAKTLNDALQQVVFLREHFDLLTKGGLGQAPEAETTPSAEWERLRRENEQLAKRLAFMQGRRSAVFPSLDAAKMTLPERVAALTTALLFTQKRPNGERARRICSLQATIFARYEAGESLKDIASDLDLLYDTAKKYLKRARMLLRMPLPAVINS